MSGLCRGSDDAEESVEEAGDSPEIQESVAPCAENKIMYFNTSDTGFWRVRKGHSTSGDTISLPQYLKVEVDGRLSCQGERYYFTILEGPLVAKGRHFNEVQGEQRGNVVKVFQGQNVLIEASPHTGLCSIMVAYESHRISKHPANYNVATVEGRFSFAGVNQLVRMQLDIIEPNVAWGASIADYPHDSRYNAKLAPVWFRIDAPTSPVNWTGSGVGADRYFHLGTGSAGCFTNVSDGGSDGSWDTVAKAMMKCRDPNSNLYAGTVTLQIPAATYAAIEEELRAASRANDLPYVWANEVRQP